MDSSFRTQEQDRQFKTTWSALSQLADSSSSDRILDYFTSEPERLNEMTTKCGDLILDYSRSAMSLAARGRAAFTCEA